MVPTAVAAAMVVGAGITSCFSGLSGKSLYLVYMATGVSISLVAVVISIFVLVARMAITGVTTPMAQIKDSVPSYLQFLALPAIIFPLFLAGFTIAKSAIPVLVGFQWDYYWVSLDFALFGTDPWRITHRIITGNATRTIMYAYTVVWGAGLAFVSSFVAIHGSRKTVTQFFTAMMLTWFVGGFLGAYLFSSAGPVFAHLVDPVLVDRFADLRRTLAATLPSNGSILGTQKYLIGALGDKIPTQGGGISAMPSMHVAAAIIYLLAARGAFWTCVSAFFAALIGVGSVHFGYHYAVDGILGAIIAVGCWFVTKSFLERNVYSIGEATSCGMTKAAGSI